MTTVEAVLGGARTKAGPRRATMRGRDLILRLIDVTASGAALIFFFTTLILIALAVRAQDGGPALFRQQRIGQGGRPFACLKFRSMVPDAERRLADLATPEWAERRKLRRDPRVTPLGRLLRLSSLDELPQLLNVLAGDMSLVGPRPIVIEERALYGRRFAAYCLIRPGLTGLWQVSGRNDVSYPRRVAMDVWLSRNLTIATYLILLGRTVPAVLGRKGVY